MLSKYFVSPARISEIRNGPSGPLIEEFGQYLFQSGYAEITVRRHIRSAEHLIHWASRQDMSVRDLTQLHLQGFGDHCLASIIFAVVLTHLRITLPGIVIPIQSSIVISNHLLTEGYFIFIVKWSGLFIQVEGEAKGRRNNNIR